MDLNTKTLPEPVCSRCLDPIFNEPLYDNAAEGLCPTCFEAKREEEADLKRLRKAIKRNSQYLR